MATTKLPVLLALLLAGNGLAMGTLEVRAGYPARVYLGDELMGETPLVLSNIPAGAHRIQVEDPGTGQLRSYMFHVPSTVDVSKVLEVEDPAPAPGPVVLSSPAPVVRTTTVRYASPRVQTVAYGSCGPSRRISTRVGVGVGYPTAPYFPSRSGVERAKVHTRNTLLGLVAANQVLNDDSRDRKRYRNVGLGLTLLNEVLR